MNYYNQIKSELISNEAYKRVRDYSKNRSDLRAYYKVGKLLIEAQGGENRAKYGDKLIKEYAKHLTQELYKKYTATSLKYMRRFCIVVGKGPTVSDQLTWSHYREIIWFKDLAKINYYINLCQRNNLSVRQLREQIKSQLYERLPKTTRQQLLHLPDSTMSHNQPKKIMQYLKDPIIINDTGNYDQFSEKILQQLILEDLPHFLHELGPGFCFIENEYKIKVNGRDNYIDLLLFNIIHNCYVVVELKVTGLKAEQPIHQRLLLG